MPATDREEFPTEVEAALKALETYGNDGKRNALLPLDSAIVQSLDKVSGRLALERRLVEILDQSAPGPAKQYVCGKLALIGESHSAKALARLLRDPKVAPDARSALEAMPDDAAAKAILRELPSLTGLERAGAIRSLGVRRYRPATRLLRRELGSTEAAVQAAAKEALCRIERS